MTILYLLTDVYIFLSDEFDSINFNHKKELT